MANTRVIQLRIRSVKNAKQITKALEVVAASRMRKVLDAVAASREYGDLATVIMSRIENSPELHDNAYFKLSPNKPVLIIVFTSDRGQAGAYNTNVFNETKKMIAELPQKPQVVVFGRKGARLFAHKPSHDLVGVYEDIADMPEMDAFAPVFETIRHNVEARLVSRVVLVYTSFVSTLSQRVVIQDLLPVVPHFEVEQGKPKDTVYELEPGIESVASEAIRIFLQARLMQSRIESAASEHAMRMVAMGNANRNATDLIDDLTLELNATRQAAITQEIAEITGGAAAIAQ